MKKLIPIFIFIILITSCKVLKVLRLGDETEHLVHSTEQSFEVKNNHMIIQLIIDNNKADFIFDTGASSIMTTNKSLIENFDTKDVITLGKVELPNGDNVGLENVQVNIKTEMFEIKNYVLSIPPRIRTKCESEDNFINIFGLDFIQHTLISDEMLKIDFDREKIVILSKDSSEILIKNGYNKIKSDFRYSVPFIFLTINGITEKFILDTGNSAFPIVLSKNSEINMEYHDKTIEGMLFSTLTGSTNKNKTFVNFKNDVIIGDEKSVEIITVKTEDYDKKYNNIGLQLIKQYNWIFDHKNEEIYFKKREVNEGVSSTRVMERLTFDGYSRVINNSLLVVTKDIKNLKYNIGDEIKAVHGMEITTENICEMQRLLNKTKDWSTLELEIIPVQY